MAHLDVRHHGDHSVHHAEAGAEDGDDGELLAGYVVAGGRTHRGLYLDLLEGQVAGRLIAHQHSDLADELAEGFGPRVLIAQDGQLVLDEGVVEYVHIAHVYFVSFLFSPRQPCLPLTLGLGQPQIYRQQLGSGGCGLELRRPAHAVGALLQDRFRSQN